MEIELEKMPVDLADWMSRIPTEKLLDIFWSTLTAEQRKKWIEAYQEEICAQHSHGDE